MGWVIKDMIDRMIAADSIHIYGDSQPHVTSDYPDKVSTEYISMAVLTEYVGKLSILSTDQVTEIARDEAHKLTQPIFDEVLDIKGQLAEVTIGSDLTAEGIQKLIADAMSKASPINPAPKTPRPVTASIESESMSFAEFKDKHPELSIDRTKATATGGADLVREALKATGLDKRYRYTSNDVKFHKLNGNTTERKVLDDGHDGQ